MAGEPWTDVQDDIVEGAGFLRLSPITLSGSVTIASFGTAIDLLQVTDESQDYTMNEPKEEFITKELSSGYVLEYPKIVKTINAITGYTKAAADSGTDQFEVKALVSKAKLDSVLAAKGKPFAACKSLGFTTQGTHAGYAHIIGYIANIKTNEKHDLVEVTFTIKGGRTFTAGATTYSTYNTAVTTATIEPVGMSALTIKALTGDNYSALLGGTIVRTAAS
jgi:hypothetical protein